MVAVLLRHYRDFAELNEQRLTLLSQQKALEAKNRESENLSNENLRLANLDSLTQIANRRSFFANLQAAFNERRGSAARLAIGVLDLDGFKPVNDMFGHPAGDKVLVEVADRISARVSNVCSVYRLGGDEFAFLIAADDLSDAALVDFGQKVCDSISEPIPVCSGVVQVTASMGIAVYPDVGVDGQDLYERADYALYSAKRESRAGVVIFNSRQAQALFRHREVQDVLLAADLERELSLVYQPIVDPGSGRTLGFEALARWMSPKLGLISPCEFIPIAEQHGRINIITRHLLCLALSEAKTWPGGPFLSFNLSPHDLALRDNVIRIAAALNECGFDPKRVNFEITETAIMRDFVQAAASLELLRALGCQIALDDFGTGFSSLNYVHKLPLSKIKIDRSFVDKINERPASFKIVKSVLTLCHEMGLSAIAEGVETKAEADVLKSLGVGAIQGYYFARPLTNELAVRRLIDELDASETKVEPEKRSA